MSESAHQGPGHKGAAHLVEMANDIAAFFSGAGHAPAAAADGVADHLRKFWDPRMRRKLIAYGHQGGAGLSDAARLALVKLEAATASANAAE